MRLTPTAKLPTRAHATDAGLDVFSDAYYTLYPGQRARIKTGIACAIPAGHVGLIWDKSGLAAKGLKTAGGVIDAGYRGEIQIIVSNLSNDIIEIDRGHKVAQLLIQEIKTPTCEEVGELTKTQRNAGGFGSTGTT
jgi:dUTP pyrophosphatase